MPTISVIMPTFRRPHYLPCALASVKSQVLPHDIDLEVIVCDNAADEQTSAIVAAAGDPRLVYVPRAHNLGMMRNAIAGFAQARGE
ncbi:MAG: glycosyltransferase, partial [Micrococcales bacterium]|nr:glycosyltransferase [Micrococcales bacterium]